MTGLIESNHKLSEMRYEYRNHSASQIASPRSATSNLDALVEWYRKVLGMGIVHRTSAAVSGKDGVPAINAAWGDQ
jgi:hypothetical protein